MVHIADMVLAYARLRAQRFLLLQLVHHSGILMIARHRVVINSRITPLNVDHFVLFLHRRLLTPHLINYFTNLWLAFF